MLVGVLHKNPTTTTTASDSYENPTTRVYDSLNTKEKYVMGIIDILTNYGFRKKVEYCLKSCFCGRSVSIVPPKSYAQRMFEFVTERVFR